MHRSYQPALLDPKLGKKSRAHSSKLFHLYLFQQIFHCSISSKVFQLRISQSNTVVHYRIQRVRESSCHVIAERVQHSSWNPGCQRGEEAPYPIKANREEEQVLTGKADQAVEIQACSLVRNGWNCLLLMWPFLIYNWPSRLPSCHWQRESAPCSSCLQRWPRIWLWSRKALLLSLSTTWTRSWRQSMLC